MTRRKYVPHLADFFYKPPFDWSPEGAEKLYRLRADSPGFDTIYCEDCVTGMERLARESVQTVIADPPFGIAFTGKERFYNRDPDNVIGGYNEVLEEEYLDFSRAWIGEVPRILAPKGSVWIVSGWSHLREILMAAHEAKLSLLNHIVWQFHFGTFSKWKFVSSHYHVLLLTKGEGVKNFFNPVTRYNLDVWGFNKQNRPGELKNGNKLPLNLVQRMVDFTTRPGDLVLDPFMGNGTTAEVCRGNYRHFIGFEVNPKAIPIQQANLSCISLGVMYKSYGQRWGDRIEEVKQQFPRAYEEYCRLVES